MISAIANRASDLGEPSNKPFVIAISQSKWPPNCRMCPRTSCGSLPVSYQSRNGTECRTATAGSQWLTGANYRRPQLLHREAQGSRQQRDLLPRSLQPDQHSLQETRWLRPRQGTNFLILPRDKIGAWIFFTSIENSKLTRVPHSPSASRLVRTAPSRSSARTRRRPRSPPRLAT